MAEGLISTWISSTDVSLTYKLSTTKECDEWFYRVDGGSWVSISNVVGLETEVTVSGLSPNTDYKIQFRGKRKGLILYLNGNVYEIKTRPSLGIYIETANKTVYLDSYNREILVNIIIPTGIDLLDDAGNNANLFFESYEATGNNNTILQKSVELVNGQTSISLTEEDCLTLLSAMPSRKSSLFTMKYSFKKNGKDYGGKYDTYSTYKIQFYGNTTAENSAPIFEDFWYYDSDPNNKTIAVTGDNQKLIQNQSTLVVEYDEATPKNGSLISAYTVTVANSSKSVFGVVSVNMGKINFTGSVPIVITAIDSRGYTTTLTKLVNFIPYQPIELSSLEVSRINDIEETTRLSLNGSINPIFIDGTDKNPFKSLTYQFKATNTTEYGEEIEIPQDKIVWSENSFSVEIPEWIDFAENSSFDIRAIVKDQLTEDSEKVTIPNGKPLLSLRKRMIGINNNAPEYALDIDGDLNLTGNVYINGTQRL